MGHVSSSGTTSHTLTRSIPAEGHEGGGCKIWGMFLLRAPLHILSH